MNSPRRDLTVPLAALSIAVIAVVVVTSAGESQPPLPSQPTLDTTTTTLAIDPTPSTTDVTPTVSTGPPIIVVTPEDDLAALSAANPAGTTFVLAPGVHRGESITPREGQTFLGRPGAVMSGAVVLTSFQPRDDIWLVGGQQAQGTVHGSCDPGHPRCAYSEDLFVDDEALVHVGTVSDVGPGSWFFDYDQDIVYIGDDPSGKIVELSVLRHAFHGDVDNVTIQGLVVEKYAVPAQEGAIDSRRDREDLIGGSGWVIADNVVRWNHGVGIAASTEALVRDNFVHENGQLGLAAKGAGVTITGNEVSGNNAAGFSAGWEGGGSKFAYTSGLVVRDNYVHDNHGMGLWTDIDNIGTLYENNRVIDNTRMGIFHEISYDAVIVGNEVRGNGFAFDAWLWGGGIGISNSINVQIYDNIVEGNADGIVAIQQDRSEAPASYGPLALENLDVHDNVINGNQGWTGLGQDVGDNTFFSSRNNRFYDNTFDQDGRHYFWLNADHTYEEWVGFGLS